MTSQTPPGRPSTVIEQLLHLPGHTASFRVHDGDWQRFARLFLRVWNRLPPDATRKIREFWRSADLPRLPGQIVDGGCVECASDGQVTASCRADQSRGRHVEHSAGFVDLAGTVLVFNATHCDAMPEEVVEVLVAHELAHVWQFATDYGNKETSYDEIESHANGLVDSWGFDLTLLMKWRDDFRASWLSPIAPALESPPAPR